MAQATGAITVVSPSEMGVKARGTITITDWQAAGGVRGTGSITINDYTSIVAAETVDINGVIVTEGTDWNATTSNNATASSLAAALEASQSVAAGGPQYYSAVAVGNVITLTHRAYGIGSNWSVNLGTGTGMSKTDLAGSTAGVSVGPGGLSAITLNLDLTTADDPSFAKAQTSNATTAENLKTALTGQGGYAGNYGTMTRDSAVLSYPFFAPGVLGNSYFPASIGGGGSGATSAQIDTGAGDAYATGTITITDYAGIAANGAFSTGTITVVDFSTILTGETVTVDGIPLIEGTDWSASTDNDTTAESIRTAIETVIATQRLVATRAGAVVTLTAGVKCAEGDEITLAEAATGVTVSGATLTGGANGVSLTIDTKIIREGTASGGNFGPLSGYGWSFDAAWDSASSNDQSASNLNGAINQIPLPTSSATAATNVVTITAATAGAAGNSIGMAEAGDAGSDVSLSGANLTGGADVDGVILTIDGVAFTANTDFDPRDTAAETATALAAAITAALPTDLASAIATDETVNMLGDEGIAGSTISLATDNTDAATVSGATFAGGGGSGTQKNRMMMGIG